MKNPISPNLAHVAAQLRDHAPTQHPCPAGYLESAVLMLVSEGREGLQVLLCERSDDNPRDAHKGQVSLPGGRRDPQDDDILATALREAGEEVGLDPARVQLLGRLDDFLTITNYHVVPFVAAIDGFDGLSPHSAEIAEVFEFPLAALSDPARVRHVPWERHGRVEDVLFIDHNGHTVWGATARMLSLLMEIIS